MALKDIMTRGNEEPLERPPTARPAAAPPRPQPSAGAGSCLDASTTLEGTIRCREALRIDGRVEGAVHCEKSVVIGEGASVRAAIEAEEVAIAGEVNGDISASHKITLNRTARVVGDLCTPGIVIEEGAKLEGRIMIGSEDEPETKPASPQPKPAAPSSSATPAPRTPPPPATA